MSTLAQQLADAAQHRPPSSRVALRSIERERRRELIDGIQTLATVIGQIHSIVSH